MIVQTTSGTEEEYKYWGRAPDYHWTKEEEERYDAKQAEWTDPSPE